MTRCEPPVAALPDEVKMSEGAHPLSAHPLLTDQQPAARAAVLAACALIELPAGDTLIEAGVLGSPLYIVECGFLDVLDPKGGGLLAELGPRAVLGELSFLQGTKTTALVRASTDAVVHALSQADARALVFAHPGLGLAIGRVAASRVRVDRLQRRHKPRILGVLHADADADLLGALKNGVGHEAQRRVVEAGWDGAGHAPGSAQHVAATRALGAALNGARQLVLRATIDSPSATRVIRNADELKVLHAPGAAIDKAMLRRLLSLSARRQLRIDFAHLGPPPDGALELRETETRLVLRKLPSHAPELVVARMLRAESRVDDTLRESVVFAGLDNVCRRELALQMRVRAYASGSTIYGADERPERLYVVLSGRVTTEWASGERIDCLPGYVFGDDGLAEAGPAQHRARGLRDGTLAWIDRRSLSRLFTRHPALRSALAEQATAGYAQARTAAMRDRATISIILPDGDPAWSARIRRMQSILGGRRQCAIIDRRRTEDACGSTAADCGPGDAMDGVVRAWLTGQEEQHRYLLYVCHAADSRWTGRCLGQTDHVLLVDDGRSEPCRLTEHGRDRKRHLALWWPADGQPAGTARWLDQDPELTWYHVREGSYADLGRLVRRLLGRAFGMVFAGASSRGIAHLGVAAGLRAADLPLDTAAGTSSGSMVAGVLCQGLPPEETLNRVLHAVTGFKARPRNIGPPLTAVFDGSRMKALALESLGDGNLEDLMIPLKITAVDLRSGEICVLDRGPLWLASRAACSIPGLWPPVAVDGKLYVDGGLVDNFPHFAIEAECHGGLTLISNLDAGYAVPYAGAPDYGATLSGWRVAWDRLLRRDVVYPDIVGTVIESMVLGGRASSADLDTRIDPRHMVICRPPIPMLALFGVERGPMVDELLKAAEQAAVDDLAAWLNRYSEGPAYSTQIPVLEDEDTPEPEIIAG